MKVNVKGGFMPTWVQWHYNGKAYGDLIFYLQQFKKVSLFVLGSNWVLKSFI